MHVYICPYCDPCSKSNLKIQKADSQKCKYNKEYYADGDLKPTEQLFFSLTIVPLGEYQTQNIIANK